VSDRPSERDLALDAIDEAFSDACKGMSRSLQSYAPGEGPGPKTAAEAKALARGIFIEARRERDAAIALINDVLSD